MTTKQLITDTIEAARDAGEAILDLPPEERDEFMERLQALHDELTELVMNAEMAAMVDCGECGDLFHRDECGRYEDGGATIVLCDECGAERAEPTQVQP